MKRSNYAATHYGECQLCGHDQKLPGGGLLSLHGYTTRWGFFEGVCPGARALPYEQSCDLLAGEIVRQKAAIKNLQARSKQIASPSFKNVFVQEDVASVSRFGGSKRAERELSPAEYKIVKVEYDGWSTVKLVWTSRQNKQEESKLYGDYPKSEAALISSMNQPKLKSLAARVQSIKGYIQWLEERIAKFVVRELRPVPVEEQGTKVIVHGVGAYWSKREGYDVAACVSSIRAAGGKLTSKDWAKVTCKACLKVQAAADAAAKLEQQAEALIAEMVAKHGDKVRVQFSDAAAKAVKELRYQRKEIDKIVRKRACDLIERGRS